MWLHAATILNLYIYLVLFCSPGGATVTANVPDRARCSFHTFRYPWPVHVAFGDCHRVSTGVHCMMGNASVSRLANIATVLLGTMSEKQSIDLFGLNLCGTGAHQRRHVATIFDSG